MNKLNQKPFVTTRCTITTDTPDIGHRFMYV